MLVNRATVWRTIATLTSTVQVRVHPGLHRMVHLREGSAWMAVAKVLAPAAKHSIDFSDDGRGRFEAHPVRSVFAKFLANSLHRLATWSHVKISLAVR